MRVPTEIEEAMWVVAESGDPETIAAFGLRYPEFRSELLQRLKLVQSLRQARPSSSAPLFAPVPNLKSQPTRLAVVGIATLVMVSIGFAGYAVSIVVKSGRPAEVTREVPRIQVEPERSPTVHAEDPAKRLEPNSAVEPSITSAPAPDEPKIVTAFETLVTISSERIRLTEALGQIAEQVGATLEFAPGMPDPEIELRYTNQPAYLVLADLGKNFGFTPFVQSVRHALIVPARDPDGAPTQPVGGYAVELPDQPSPQPSN